MPGRKLVLALGALLLAPALAGCADEAPSAEQVRPGSTTLPPGMTEDDVAVKPAPKPVNARWHFHDHWKGQPTIEIFNATTTLNATQGGDGLPALSAILVLAEGDMVPPEAGVVSITATWAEGTTGLLNVTFRPADSNGFYAAGDLANGGVVNISVTESMADVPHRAKSLWVFNLTAKPGGTPPAVPTGDIVVRMTATIGRPLFIDPPHLDWWQEYDVLPLVMGVQGTIETTARTPAGNVTLPGLSPATKPAQATEPARVPVEAGRIVPEGSQTIVVLLNWTTDLPDKKLVVNWRESNLPSSGAMEIVRDGPANRVFIMPVDPDQTDTTYSNRTTWEFEVLPEEETDAFRGGFTLYAWVARVEVEEALRDTIGADV